MKIKTFSPIKQEFAEGVPEEIFRVLQPLNSQLEDVTRALQGRIDGANLTEEIISIFVENDVPVRVRLQSLRQVPKDAFLAWTGVFSYAHLAWRVVSEDAVELKVKWDDPPTSRSPVRIVFRGGA